MRSMKNMNMWILVVVVLGFLYMSRESFKPATSPCPSMCRTRGNMHPVCVQGRQEGRPNCGHA